MSENTSPLAPSHTPLLDELYSLLQAHRSAFKQEERTFLRSQALALGHLFCFARRTITQSLLSLGLVDSDWSAFYRLFSAKERIDYDSLSETFLRETLPLFGPTDPYTAIVDGVQIPRHSSKMAGTSWLRNPMSPPSSRASFATSASRIWHACRLQARMATALCFAHPLRARLPRDKAIEAEGIEPRKEWEAALESIGWLRERLDAAGEERRDLLVVADGSSYCVVDLIKQLPERVTLMARCAKNRALYELPGKRDHKNRKYAQRAMTPEGWLCKRKGFKHKKLKLRGRELNVR